MQDFRFKIFLNLIRALFPRWNFFDRVGHHFEVEFKLQKSAPWEKISFAQKRQSFSLFLNPNVNLALAQVNIIEHFVSDLADLQKAQKDILSDDIQTLTTFKLLRSLLRVKMEAYGSAAGTFQFRILACSPSERSDVYVSDWISGGGA